MDMDIGLFFRHRFEFFANPTTLVNESGYWATAEDVW